MVRTGEHLKIFTPILKNFTGFDLVGKWHCYNHDFTVALDPSEYPISVLTRTQTPFSSRLLGVYDPDTGERILFDCLGMKNVF